MNKTSIVEKSKFMKKIGYLVSAALLLILTACSGGQGAGTELASTGAGEIPSAQRDIFAMDTYMTVTCYGERCEEAADAAEAEIKRLDDLLSVGNPDSEISRINRDGKGVLSDDTNVMVEKAMEISRQTGGAFDITVFPLMELWGFTTQDYNVPKKAELDEVLSRVGSEKLTLKDGELTLGDSQGIDLGGIAKGYTSDRLMDIFEEYDLEAGMISLGGNVELYHAKPDGNLWKVGIQNPHVKEDGSSDLLGVLEAKDCAVITSGAYERYFVGDDGTHYHHIIDPASGYPANNGLISVTIVSPSGILADSLSTAFYVMGLDETIRFYQSSKEEFDLILMTEDDEVYITEPLKDRFSTEYPVHVIDK